MARRMKLKVVLDEGAFLPKYANEHAVGMDIFSPVRRNVPAHGSTIIMTGVHVDLVDTAGIEFPKSGLNFKHDLLTFGAIDPDYRGEIGVKIYNLGSTDYEINVGDKITQMIVLDYVIAEPEVVERLNETARGEGGFGSTGR